MPSHADAWNSHSGGPRAGMTAWLFPALILSLLLHWLLWMWAGGIHLTGAVQQPESTRPYVMKLQSVTMPTPPPLPPAVAELAPVRQTASVPKAIQVPDEKSAFVKMMGKDQVTPGTPQIDKTMLSEKPASAPTTWADTVQAAEAGGAQSATENLDSVRREMLKDKPGVTGSSLMNDSQPLGGGGTAGQRAREAGGGKTPGFSNLDDLLASTGPLTPETAPILMPTDLLFDFDSSQLRPDADASLSKLAELIKRNPNVRFRIEGHTDSFGSDEYNMNLSLQRAEGVRTWLVSITRVPAATIETKGYGKTRLIAPASGTQDEQQINRRVAIVILPGTGASPARPSQ